MAWTKEQMEAITKGGSNIIVSAGAGSGKTAVLSERVIDKLTHGVHIDELLILTFTRAAAEEMKDRIRENIKKKEELQGELDRIDSSYITTFDSFALAVVKKYHYLLNLPKDISITDDAIVDLQRKRLIDELFDTLYEEENRAFLDLLKQFTYKNDESIRKALLSLSKKIDTYIDPQGYLEYLKNDFFASENIGSILKDYWDLIEENKRALASILNTSYNYFDSDYTDKLDSLLLPIINAKSISELISFSGVSLPRVPTGTDEEAKKIKNTIKKTLDELMSLCAFGEEEDIVSYILESQETVSTFVMMLERYYENLKNYKRENGIFTFADIATFAKKIVKEHEEVANELKSSFKEIMIDEYQDTNDIQESFISLIANDNVYMVGDIKQSIYRFRGSNPLLFKSKYDAYSRNIGGYKIDLIKNFRSRSETLDNINRIFDLLMDDVLGGAAYTVSHEMVFGNEDYTDLRMSEYDYNAEIRNYEPDETGTYANEEIEIFAIADDIKKKIENGTLVYDKKSKAMRPFSYNDAVIILDRSTYFDKFKSIFEYVGIPLTILKDETLNASSIIYLFKNAIDLIVRILDKDFEGDFRRDILSLSRSFLYECSDDELFHMFKTNSFSSSRVYQDFAHISNIYALSIREILEVIIEKTGMYEKLYKIGNFKDNALQIEKLLDLADSLGNLGYSLVEFSQYMNDLIASGLEVKYTAYAPEADSVKIMTIHKSKGLEYAFCYFADLDHSFNTADLREKFISDSKYGLIVPRQIEDADDEASVLKILYKAKYKREEIGEKIRLFYVALTRAREKFYIYLPKREVSKFPLNSVGTIEETSRLKFKSLADFVYSIQDFLPYYFKDLDVTKLSLTKEYLYNKTLNTLKANETYEKFTVNELAIEKEKITRKRFSNDTPELLTKESVRNMILGTKVHEMLEYIDFKNYDSSSIDDEYLRRKVDALMNCEIMKNIEEAKIYHEYEFVYNNGDNTYHGSIDLMIEYPDHIDIVDYKLKNTQDEHYIKQLGGYRAYIENVTSKSVKTYLYSIIDEKIYPLG